MLINGLKSIKTKIFLNQTSFSLHSKKNGINVLKHSKINGCRVFKKLHIFLSILHRLTQSQNASKINAYRDMTTE